MRTSDDLIAHGCLGLSFCGLAAMGGGGKEAAGTQFRTLETQAQRVLTVISSQREKSGLSSAATMTFLDRQLLPAGTQKGSGRRKASSS